MSPISSNDRLPVGYSEDKPFCMSEPTSACLTDSTDMDNSLQTLSKGAMQILFPRNRIFSGICLALPLSALLWVLFYYVLQLFTA